MSSGRHARRERERAKQARADHKKERREIRKTDAAEAEGAAPPKDRTQSDVLAELAELHQAHEDGRIEFDEFESTKAELLSQLQV